MLFAACNWARLVLLGCNQPSGENVAAGVTNDVDAPQPRKSRSGEAGKLAGAADKFDPRAERGTSLYDGRLGTQASWAQPQPKPTKLANCDQNQQGTNKSPVQTGR